MLRSDILQNDYCKLIFTDALKKKNSTFLYFFVGKATRHSNNTVKSQIDI